MMRTSMPHWRSFVCFLTLSFHSYADCGSSSSCCGASSGIAYCDSSIGRYICQNGEISSCYCTRHAVMGLERLKGCCLWHGGVAHTNAYGAVICRDNQVSEVCSLQNPPEHIVSW